MASGLARRVRTTVSPRARRAVPERAKPALRALLDVVDPVRLRLYRRRSGVVDPIPPRRLRARVGQPDLEHFVVGGRKTADSVLEGIAAGGLDLPEAGPILDFGCGCGRTLIPLASRAGGTELNGCDIDAQAIGWLRNSVRATLAVNDFTPPLPYDDGSLGVLYSISIFTHLDEPSQDAWLGEMCRVVRPGGLILVSTHGTYPYEEFREGRHPASNVPVERLRERGTLEDEGFIFEPYELAVAATSEYPGITGVYGLTFQDPDHSRRRWCDRLPVEWVAVEARAVDWWQDLIVLRRRDGEAGQSTDDVR